jgi:hypothetical protein
MGKSVKRAAKGPAHLRLVSVRAKAAQLAERRRASNAEGFATRLATDMIRGQMTAPAKARGKSKSGRKAKAAGSAAHMAAFALAPAPAGYTADVTDELRRGAQSFGEVLEAIGNGIVLSQAALDDAAIETAKQLSQTTLDVAVAIRQELDDNGDLVPGAPTIDPRKLSLSSFILPTLHQWQHVAVSMDLTVSELDATTGVKVKSGGASASVSKAGFGFSAAAAFNYSSVDAESRFKADFAGGAIRLDALLGPREEFRFPEINEFAIGPQILVTQAATAGSAAPPNPAFRKVTLTIKLLDLLGKALTGTIDVRLPVDLRRRLKSWTTGMVSAPGSIDFNLDTPFLAQPAQNFRVELKYGDLSKIVDVTI